MKSVKSKKIYKEWFIELIKIVTLAKHWNPELIKFVCVTYRSISSKKMYAQRKENLVNVFISKVNVKI